MRVEAKDRKNPSMICVATITEVRNRRLLVHFDGWSDHFNYWCSPDTTDIHPPMWCGKNSKRVEPPYGICSPCVFVGTLVGNNTHIGFSMCAMYLCMYIKDTIAFIPTYTDICRQSKVYIDFKCTVHVVQLCAIKAVCTCK